MQQINQLKESNKMSNAFKLTPTCKAVITVFPVAKDKRVEGGPVLTGYIKADSKPDTENAYQVAFFEANWKNTELEGFSIKVQTNDGVNSKLRCYGAAFKRNVPEGSKAPNYGIVLNLGEDEVLGGVLWKQIPKDAESKIKSYLSGNLAPVDKPPASKKAAKSAAPEAEVPASKTAAKPAAKKEALVVHDEMDDEIPF